MTSGDFKGSAVDLCVYPRAEVGLVFQWWKTTLDELLDSLIGLNRLLQCSSTTDLLTPRESCLPEQQVSLQPAIQMYSIELPLTLENVMKWEERWNFSEMFQLLQ